MIYCNTPLSGSLQSLMQILQSRCARSDIPLSTAARKQLGLQSEKLRTVYKDDVIYKDVTSKMWYPATITSLCAQPRSYKITIRECVTYRKIPAHLKSYQPQCKTTEDEHSDNN